MRSERGVEVSSHLTEYENSILRTFWPRSTRCSGSAETLTSMMCRSLYAIEKSRWVNR